MRVWFGGGFPAVCLAAGWLAGCASQQAITEQAEQMLAAAGFVQKPADTPRREARLASLPPYRVLAQPLTANGQETIGYVYADPQFCHCVFVGDSAAYSRFEQFAFQQRMAREQIEAAEIANEDMFGWGDWGPYPFWGGGGVVFAGGVAHDHDFHGGAPPAAHFGGRR